MKTSPRWQSGLLYLLAWLALGLANASVVQAATIVTVPTVTLTAPTDGATYIAPASITLSATAAESGGTIARVDFYSGTTLLGTSTSSPYTLTLTNVAAGSYTYSATAYDSLGVSATSTNASVTVNPVSTVPTVTLTAPTDGATYIAPASITLSATAAESGGTIARVDFYSGTSLLAAATAAPYSYTWSNIPVGSYTFTAVATDTSNISTTSSPVSVSVGAAAVTQIYYIYTDQLNTPRLITDTANTPVWRNDQADPFNASAPYDDPGNTGHHFVFNLRFPGQYYDQETGLAYNYYRDYDPSTGRYIQSDPIGLAGGMNTYAYVDGNPLKYVDQKGLAGVLPGLVPLPIPGPSSPVQSKPTDDGSYGGLFPPGTIPTPIDPYGPDVHTEQRVPPLPPIEPPGQGGDQFCQKVLERCMKVANSCPTPVKQTVTSGCFATYLLCRASARGSDHHSDQ